MLDDGTKREVEEEVCRSLFSPSSLPGHTPWKILNTIIQAKFREGKALMIHNTMVDLWRNFSTIVLFAFY